MFAGRPELGPVRTGDSARRHGNYVRQAVKGGRKDSRSPPADGRVLERFDGYDGRPTSGSHMAGNLQRSKPIH